MSIGRSFLVSISSGIVTQEELNWIATNALAFSRSEKANALGLWHPMIQGKFKLEEDFKAYYQGNLTQFTPNFHDKINSYFSSNSQQEE